MGAEPAAAEEQRELGRRPEMDIDERSNHSDDETVDDEQPLIAETPESPEKMTTAKPKRVGAVLLRSLGLGLMFVAIIFFSIRVLHSRRHAHSSSQNSTKPRPKKAIDWALDFPALYPQISSPPNSECWTAWQSLSAVPCHGKLFDRSRDNGTFQIMGADPMHYVPLICEERCNSALEAAHSLITEKCSPDDRFLLDGYTAKFFNTTFLEPGPAASLQVLMQRRQHTCRKSPLGDNDYDYCTIELQQRFVIVDGMNAQNVAGISSFMRETDEKRVERARRVKGVKGTNKYTHPYDYMVREQHYGPLPGSTTCGWCTLNFFERKLNSWTEGSILSPDSGVPISLPEFIHRIKAAGERCETVKWEEIYNAAISKYQASGLLPSDWEQLPSGDLYYLIKNGIGPGDEPLPSIRAAFSPLDEEEKKTGRPWVPRGGKECLQGLSTHLESLHCYIYLERSTLHTIISEPIRTPNLRAAYCSKKCTDDIGKDGLMRACHRDVVRNHPIVKPFLDAYMDAKTIRERICADSGDYHSSPGSCSHQFAEMNYIDWILDARPASSAFITALEADLDKIKHKPVPDDIRPAVEGLGREVLTSSGMIKIYDSWMNELKAGVCSQCIWAWLVGTGSQETPLEFLRQADSVEDYLDFARRLHDTCTRLGATWLGGIPYGDDPVIWRVQEVGGKIYRYREAENGFQKGRVYKANEATDEVVIPFKKSGSIWHLLAAARQLEAERQGTVSEWMTSEQAHRDAEDRKVWDINDFGINWIPKAEREKKQKEDQGTKQT